MVHRLRQVRLLVLRGCVSLRLPHPEFIHSFLHPIVIEGRKRKRKICRTTADLYIKTEWIDVPQQILQSLAIGIDVCRKPIRIAFYIASCSWIKITQIAVAEPDPLLVGAPHFVTERSRY